MFFLEIQKHIFDDICHTEEKYISCKQTKMNWISTVVVKRMHLVLPRTTTKLNKTNEINYLFLLKTNVIK